MYGRRRAGLGLFLLVAQLLQVGFDRIPPVTLSVIALNTGLYLNLLNGLPRVGEACVSVNSVWFGEEWRRLFLAPFFHLNDWHLYLNMASFLWKGKSLERSLGSSRFLYIISIFSVLTSILLLGLDVVFARIFNDPSYMYTCAAGFSGVVFALKVLTTYNLPRGMTYVIGIPVPVRYACWAELLVIQVLIPNASFSGHLAGIIIGMLYVKGPLKRIMDAFSSIVSGEVGGRYNSGPSYSYHSGTAGGTGVHTTQRNRRSSEDEQLQEAINRSLQETHYTPSSNTQNVYEPPTDDATDPEMQMAIRNSFADNQRSTPQSGNHRDSSSDGIRRRNIYPNVSDTQSEETVVPSAPPLLDLDNSEGSTPPSRSTRLRGLTEQELREQRIRRFQR